MRSGPIAILVGFPLVARCHHPTPSAAEVEIASGVVVAVDQQNVINELVVVFDRAAVTVQHADLDALMLFYVKSYNYHGLKRPDVRRVWDEVFTHYGPVMSKDVFTELKVVQAGAVKKAYVICLGGLYGAEKETGKPITIDS